MPYIHIWPEKYSLRPTLAVFRLIRAKAVVRHHTIMEIAVNGCGDWTITVSCNGEDGEVEIITKALSDNLDMVKCYCVNDIPGAYW